MIQKKNDKRIIDMLYFYDRCIHCNFCTSHSYRFVPTGKPHPLILLRSEKDGAAL